MRGGGGGEVDEEGAANSGFLQIAFSGRKGTFTPADIKGASSPQPGFFSDLYGWSRMEFSKRDTMH